MSDTSTVGARSTDGWRAEATSWLEARLAEAGITRTGEVKQPRVRPWGTVLRAPTTAGTVWLKASAPATAFEVALYPVLHDHAQDAVLEPIALDQDRGWLVLPDGGVHLGDIFEGEALVALRSVQARLKSGPCDPTLLRLRDACLEPFGDLGTHAELVETLETACHAGKIARAQVWHRAIGTMPPEEAGELADAPLYWLGEVLEPSPLGGLEF